MLVSIERSFHPVVYLSIQQYISGFAYYYNGLFKYQHSLALNPMIDEISDSLKLST
jgi:hypothetical protein